MGRDEEVTVELPVAETEGSPDRVYVPPKTVPPRTKVATMEVETVQIQSDPLARQEPTIRLPRTPQVADSQEVPTDRPGQLWKARDEPGDMLAQADVDESGDAVTLRLPPVGAPDAAWREAITQPPLLVPRDAATLSPSELELRLSGLDAGSEPGHTPRPESRITGEELEAIQSARTLEVRHAPGPPPSLVATRHRGLSAAIVIGGAVLGVFIVWAAVIVGRSSRSMPVAPKASHVAPALTPAPVGSAVRRTTGLTPIESAEPILSGGPQIAPAPSVTVRAIRAPSLSSSRHSFPPPVSSITAPSRPRAIY